MKPIVRLATVAAIVCGLVLGVSALFTDAQARRGGCLCPDIYAPVTCDNGVTYPNSCVASCNGGRNCVAGDIM